MICQLTAVEQRRSRHDGWCIERGPQLAPVRRADSVAYEGTRRIIGRKIGDASAQPGRGTVALAGTSNVR
jgi:hypothetical protein